MDDFGDFDGSDDDLIAFTQKEAAERQEEQRWAAFDARKSTKPAADPTAIAPTPTQKPSKPKRNAEPKWPGDVLFGRGTFFRWSWQLHDLLRTHQPKRRSTAVRNALLLLCYLLNLHRKKHVGNERRKENWDGWMRCTVRYVYNGTELNKAEQKTAFKLLERWVSIARRGQPGRRFCKVNLDKLIEDLKEYRKAKSSEPINGD